MSNLNDKRIAILVADGFEEEELTRPRQALDEAGAETIIVSPAGSEVRAWDHGTWSKAYEVDESLDDADPAHFDALLLPGGVMNPDNMRRDPAAQYFVREMFDNDKPVAAICHAPWLLIDAGVAEGRRLTSYHTLQQDLKNAGAKWVDEAVVRDGNLVTSRNPGDIPAFNEAILELFAA